MLSEAPSCGDLGVCRMAFVPAGVGCPTVSGHTQGRGSWQGQWSLRESFLLRWDRCDVKIPRRSYPWALSHSGLFCVARQRGNWPQPQNGPKLPVRFTVSEPHTHSPATSSVALSPDK
jgi:hypothetical protein